MAADNNATAAEIRHQLAILQAQCESSKDLRDTIELLIKVTRNILPPKEPDAIVDPKHRQINPLNANFNAKVWRKASGRQILQMSGWTRVGEGAELRLVHIPSPGTILPGDLIQILVDARTIAPSEAEWVARTKIENVGSTAAEKFRLDQIRGAAERDKEYAEALQEKKERKEMGERIRRQIQEDCANRAAKNARMFPPHTNTPQQRRPSSK